MPFLGGLGFPIEFFDRLTIFAKSASRVVPVELGLCSRPWQPAGALIPAHLNGADHLDHARHHRGPAIYGSLRFCL